MATTKPQDHKLPKTRTRTVTVQGVTLDVDPDVFDDLDMLEWLWDIQNADDDGNELAIVPFMRRICGPAWPKVKATLRDETTGRIPMEAVAGFIRQLMGEIVPNS